MFTCMFDVAINKVFDRRGGEEELQKEDKMQRVQDETYLISVETPRAKVQRARLRVEGEVLNSEVTVKLH